VHRMTAPWSSTSTTGSLGFQATPSATATLAARSPSGWMSWGVTQVVADWVSETSPNHGFLVKRATEPLKAGGPSIGSSASPDQRPKLEVTYTPPVVSLADPGSLHPNGAELEWTHFDAASGGFSNYEVHRSEAAGFTLSAETLLATIGDVDQTTFRDTTAAPSKTYSYKVMANGSASNERRVTLPAAGKATIRIQPGPDEAQDTYIWVDPSTVDPADSACLTYGASPRMMVGTVNDSQTFEQEKDRGLIHFDVSSIPADATIESATLELYVAQPAENGFTVGVHQLTSGWTAGSGLGDPRCIGGGASWGYREPDVDWQQPGADYVSSPEATKVHATGEPPDWDRFEIVSLVRKWVRASAPNLGVLLKSQDEQDSHKVLSYATGEETAKALRPKLTVTYMDTDASEGPTVAINAPGPGETLRGTVPVSATAVDDGRVDRVQFFADGAAIGTDTTEPYSLDWNSTGVANGSRMISAKATDDVGNVTTSAGVSVDVANSAPPSTRVLSPSSVYEDLVKADAPSAWWRLGEMAGTTAADASGNGRGGAIEGTHTLGQPGLLVGNTDKALKLADGATDGKVTVSSMGGLLGTRLSAEAWIDYAGVSTLSGENRVISRNWGASGGWQLGLVKDGAGVQRARWAINVAGTVVAASAAVTPGKLHLVGSYDGATLRLYVNGAEVASAPLSSAALDSSAAIYLGQAVDVDQTLDEAAVYARALSGEQVTRHYDVGVGADPSVTGETTVEAAASDDGSVSKVEFYVDGTRFGEDSAAPYAASLKTLDAAEPTYDGAHVVSTKAYDNHGQVTSSSDAKVKVVNAAASKFLAGFASTEYPQAMLYDPAAGATQEKAGIDVTVTNNSAVSWSATDVVLRYRWVSPDPASPAPSMTSSADLPLGAALAPNQSATVRALVDPPTLPEGVDMAQYRLRFDLHENSSGSWFAAKGNQPLEKPVMVRKALEMALGLERYYHYDGEELGAGMQHLVNVANGNSLVRFTPFEAPGRGLSTVLDLTYNSLEKKCECPAGNNVSLSISGLTRFGNPIDIHPNKADEIAGRANRFVEFTDGDGTTHRFIGKQASDGSVYWEEPAGVHLYLRSLGGTDTTRRWALTRPDRVTFYYDVDGYPTSIEDANGNRITFVLEDVPPAGDPGGPKRRIAAVRDAGGRSFTVTYYSKADAKKPQIRGKIKRITDHSGSPLDFSYYEDGNLLRLTQRGGTKADGTFLADRAFVFTYTTSNGDGPAIPAAADRADPDPKTSNQSTRLFSVRDPQGKETTFAYLGSGSGQDRWKLASRTDRSGATTSYAYDSANRVTTVSAPLSRVSRFAYDSEGKVTRITDPLDRATVVQWTGDRMVEKVTEPGGRYTSFAYNDNGYVTDVREVTKLDPLAISHTQLSYENLAADATGDVAGKWKAGRTIPHWSQLKTGTSPKGTATASPANDFQWDFGYDARGNLTEVLDPENRAAGKKTLYTYDGFGQLLTATDPNGHPDAVRFV
jgi:YD repeat-containing protein